MSGPLEGVRILDLTWGVAGSLGVMMLTDQGADVIKIEPPGGDPFRDTPGSPVWHRGRRSIVIDLKKDEGRELLLDLCATADVLAESFAPGTMAKLGLSYDEIMVRNPRLIYASLTGYPEGHRFAKRPGWDALVQARSGAQFEQPAWRPGPAHLHMQIPSMGAFFLFSTAILAALVERQKSGIGQHVSTSLYQGVAAYTTMIWQDVENLRGQASLIMAKTYPPGVHQVSIYECANGEWMHAGINVGRKATKSMEAVLGVPEVDPQQFVADLEYRRLHQQALRTAFLKRNRTQLLEEFFAVGIGADPITPSIAAYEYPQFLANDMVVDVDDYEFGPMKQVGIPARYSKTPSSLQGGRPRVGQHSHSILEDLGYDKGKIDALLSNKVIA